MTLMVSRSATSELEASLQELAQAAQAAGAAAGAGAEGAPMPDMDGGQMSLNLQSPKKPKARL